MCCSQEACRLGRCRNELDGLQRKVAAEYAITPEQLRTPFLDYHSRQFFRNPNKIAAMTAHATAVGVLNR